MDFLKNPLKFFQLLKILENTFATSLIRAMGASFHCEDSQLYTRTTLQRDHFCKWSTFCDTTSPLLVRARRFYLYPGAVVQILCIIRNTKN